MDEDFLGKVTKVSSKTHRVTFVKRTFERYRLKLFKRWSSNARRFEARKLLRTKVRLPASGIVEGGFWSKDLVISPRGVSGGSLTVLSVYRKARSQPPILLCELPL